MLALHHPASNSIECHTVPQHHPPNIASPVHPLPLLRVSLGGSWWENVCAQQAVPCSRLQCVEPSVDWQEGWMPSPLLRGFHSPPLPQRRPRCQPPHLRELLHHPPTTQRRSARPHAHHSPSFVQPLFRPPHGGDVTNRTTLYSPLLPLPPSSSLSPPPPPFHLLPLPLPLGVLSQVPMDLPHPSSSPQAPPLAARYPPTPTRSMSQRCTLLARSGGDGISPRRWPCWQPTVVSWHESGGWSGALHRGGSPTGCG